LSCFDSPLDEAYGEKADIYSYGVVWWELLTRKKPFASLSPMRVISGVAFDGLRLEVPEEAPSGVRKLVNQCFASRTSRRPTASEILQKLDQMFGARD